MILVAMPVWGGNIRVPADLAEEAPRADQRSPYLRPADFEANEGQWRPGVRFAERGPAVDLFFMDAAVGILFKRESEDDPVYSAAFMRFVEGSATPPVGESRLPWTSNHFQGGDPARWVVGAQHFGQLRYPAVWPGIDIVFREGPADSLEYDFLLSPAADISMIRLAFDGAAVAVANDGSLQVSTRDGTVSHARPIAWIPTTYESVDVRYDIRADGSVGLVSNSYRGGGLYIDPVLGFSSRVGGVGRAVAVDADGSVFFASAVFQPADFPVTAGAFETTFASSQREVGLLKLSPEGDLVWGTFFGGSGRDEVMSIAVAPDHSIVVFGHTQSADLPVVNAYQTTFRGALDLFVARIAPDGRSLGFSTYLGGTGIEDARRVAVDGSGDILLVGATTSGDFPTRLAAQSNYAGGGADGFVAKLASSGSSLLYSTYYGGQGFDSVSGLALDPSSSFITVGYTESANLPLIQPFQSVRRGPSDATVARFSGSGEVLLSSYMGGSGTDSAVSVTRSGSKVYVAGYTGSSDFPGINGFQTILSGVGDEFVSRLTASTLQPEGGTLFGGSGSDSPRGLTIDATGNVIVGLRSDTAAIVVTDPILPKPSAGPTGVIANFSADLMTLISSSHTGASPWDLTADGRGVLMAGEASGYVPLQNSIVDGENGNAVIARLASSTATPPSEPLGLSIEATSSDRIALSWKSPRDHGGIALTGYTVYRWDSTTSGLDAVATYPRWPNPGGLHKQGIPKGLLQCFTIAASNAAGEGAPAPPVAILLGDPSEPTGDLDDDGILDLEELNAHLTNPCDVDSDRDGLTDGQEIETYSTDPRMADSDADSLQDGVEIGIESDPNSPDTDSDGLGDADDETPTRESIPPAYVGAIDAFLVFESAGFIDLVVSVPNAEETNLRSVGLTGVLDARDSNGPLATPLYFAVEAGRSPDALWHARYALPPGIIGVDRERISVFAVDESSNGWQASGSFTVTLGAPSWDTTANGTAAASGFTYKWATSASPPLPGSPSTSSGEFTTFRLRPALNYDVVTKASGRPLAGTLVLAEDAFVASNFAPPSFSWAPVTIGFASDWVGRVPELFSSPPRAANSFAAVILPVGYPTGKGVGELIAGFTWAGDIETCVIQDVPEDLVSFDTLFWTTSCVSVGFLVAGTVTGQPEVALGGKVAVEGIEATAKAGRTGFQFLRDLAKGADECAQHRSACGDVAEVAERSGKDAVKVGKLARLHEALGLDAVRALEARNPAILDRIPAIEDGLRATGRSDEAIKAAYKNAYRVSEIGDEANTFDKLTELHKAFADHPGVSADAAARVFENSAKFVDKQGVDDWVEVAKRQANPKDPDGWSGFAFEADQYARLAEGIEDFRVHQRMTKFEYTDLSGKVRRPNEMEVDAFVGSGPAARFTEIKSGDIIETPGSAKFTAAKEQLNKQAQAVSALHRTGDAAAILDWRIEGSVSAQFRDFAQDVASARGITVQLLDARGNAIQVFV